MKSTEFKKIFNIYSLINTLMFLFIYFGTQYLIFFEYNNMIVFDMYIEQFILIILKILMTTNIALTEIAYNNGMCNYKLRKIIFDVLIIQIVIWIMMIPGLYSSRLSLIKILIMLLWMLFSAGLVVVPHLIYIGIDKKRNRENLVFKKRKINHVGLLFDILLVLAYYITPLVSLCSNCIMGVNAIIFVLLICSIFMKLEEILDRSF